MLSGVFKKKYDTEEEPRLAEDIIDWSKRVEIKDYHTVDVKVAHDTEIQVVSCSRAAWAPSFEGELIFCVNQRVKATLDVSAVRAATHTFENRFNALPAQLFTITWKDRPENHPGLVIYLRGRQRVVIEGTP